MENVYTIDDFSPEAVIIDAGSFPANPLALRWLSGKVRVVCCDGAANRYVNTGYPLWRIVGDCDSLSPDIALRYKDIIRRFPDQDTNDQTKSVKYLHRKGIRRIVVLGATGMREDHTFGNIALLDEYRKMGMDVRTYTDYGVFIACEGDREFRCHPGSQISIFSLGASSLKSEGLKYPVRDFDALWQGTLNEAVKERFTIYAHGRYIVFINYPA